MGTPDPHDVTAAHGPTGGPIGRALEGSRFLVAVGVAGALVLAAVSFGWALVKAVRFAIALAPGGDGEDAALVKLFESVDTLLIGTVLLIIAVGLWELFIGDLRLPSALTISSFDDLKKKVATTLLLVLVVRFLEVLVEGPPSGDLLNTGIAVTLVGALLVVYARWR